MGCCHQCNNNNNNNYLSSSDGKHCTLLHCNLAICCCTTFCRQGTCAGAGSISVWAPCAMCDRPHYFHKRHCSHDQKKATEVILQLIIMLLPLPCCFAFEKLATIIHILSTSARQWTMVLITLYSYQELILSASLLSLNNWRHMPNIVFCSPTSHHTQTQTRAGDHIASRRKK